MQELAENHEVVRAIRANTADDGVAVVACQCRARYEFLAIEMESGVGEAPAIGIGILLRDLGPALRAEFDLGAVGQLCSQLPEDPVRDQFMSRLFEGLGRGAGARGHQDKDAVAQTHRTPSRLIAVASVFERTGLVVVCARMVTVISGTWVVGASACTKAVSSALCPVPSTTVS